MIFSINVPDEIHKKLRLMSVYKDSSLNKVINDAIIKSITEFENNNGELPINYGNNTQ